MVAALVPGVDIALSRRVDCGIVHLVGAAGGIGPGQQAQQQRGAESGADEQQAPTQGTAHGRRQLFEQRRGLALAARYILL
ncbi:hypothetical protein D3C76_1609840 [compost metagenome]